MALYTIIPERSRVWIDARSSVHPIHSTTDGLEGFVDLEPMIRDNVVPSFPFAPLHAPDCLGLCARCGGDRNLGECTCEEPVDDRWAALAGLDFDIAGIERAESEGGE